MKKIGIGIIGTGFARRVQIPAFRMCGNAEIVSVASARLENAESAAKESGIPHFTDNWRKCIENEGVDLVCITTPPDLHMEQALYALSLKKHVLCEKPMAMNSEEASEMLEKAKEAGVMAIIDHELRFLDGRKKAYDLIRSGRLGKICGARYTFRNPQRADPAIPWNWWSDAGRGGGALGAIGSHAIDSLLWFTGAEADGVFCQLKARVKQRKDSEGNSRPVTSDDEANMIIRLNDNEFCEDALGIISISMAEFPDYQHHMEFIGSKGSMRVGYKGEISIADGSGKWEKIEVDISPGIDGIFDSGFPGGFVAFAPKIIESLSVGEIIVKDAATFEDGLRIQRILDAARESNDKGILVRIAR